MLYTLLAAAAWASPVYPTEVEAALAMPCVPTCTICHETLGGGSGTVTRAFGIAMQDRGLTGGSDVPGLTSALDTMTLDGVDSDADGTIDTDELTAGQDPNPGGIVFCDVAVLTPHYGCGVVPHSATGVAAALLALFGLVARRRA